MSLSEGCPFILYFVSITDNGLPYRSVAHLWAAALHGQQHDREDIWPGSAVPARCGHCRAHRSFDPYRAAVSALAPSDDAESDPPLPALPVVISVLLKRRLLCGR